MADKAVPSAEDGVDRIQRDWQRERPGMPVESIGVITRIGRIAKLLSDERRRTEQRMGLDGPTCDLLSTLRRCGPPYRMSPGEIARQNLVSAGAISQRLTRAEQRGLVQRTKDGADGRSVMVELTEQGHRLIEDRVDDLLRHEEALLSALDQPQREELTGLLRLLHHDLGDRLGAED